MALNSSNINQITEQIKLSGLAYNNRYEVTIFPPSSMRVSNFSQMRSLSIRCDSISVPGRSFSTTPYRFYGPARNMPYEQIYSGELTMSVMLSDDLRERDFFETWMTSISSPTNYKMNFYDDYVSTLEIDVLAKDQDEPMYKITVEEVYPKTLGDIQVGYDKENEFMKQEIILSFRKYTRLTIPKKVPPRPPANSPNPFFGNRSLPNVPSTDSRSAINGWYDQAFQRKPNSGTNTTK